MKLGRTQICLFVLLVALVSCAKPPVGGSVTDNIEQTLQEDIDSNNRLEGRRPIPRAVNAALLPKFTPKFPEVKPSVQRRFDIAVKDVSARNFFMGLVEGTPYSMVVSPEIKGQVTLKLKNVTIDEVLRTMRDVYGYSYKRTSVGYEIVPNRLETQIFNVNYLDVERNSKSLTEVNSGQITHTILGNSPSGANASQPGSVGTSSEQSRSNTAVVTSSKAEFWKQLEKNIESLITKEGGRSIVVNPQAGLVIVRAYPRELAYISRYLDSIQSHMQRQVILEAKILEVQLNNSYQAGIDWAVLKGHFNLAFAALNKDIPGTDITAETFPNDYTLSVNSGTGSFNAVLQALETQGNVQVLSSPRVSTLNNQKAVIKVGDDSFFITGVSSTVSGSTSDQLTQNVELTPFFSGISLDVMPQIDGRRNVTLHIHPSVSEVVDQTKVFTIGSQTSQLPLASSTIRESDSLVHARDGEVIVIGGLMQKKLKESIGAVPFINRVPVLGSAFRVTRQTAVKSELVILLKATVIKKHAWNKELRRSKHSYKSLNRGFHVGGRPEIFGTEGEVNS